MDGKAQRLSAADVVLLVLAALALGFVMAGGVHALVNADSDALVSAAATLIVMLVLAAILALVLTLRVRVDSPADPWREARMGIVALVAGGLAWPLTLLHAFPGLVMGVLAVGIGAFGMKRDVGRGVAIAGIILGAVYLVSFVACSLFGVLFVISSAL